MHGTVDPDRLTTEPGAYLLIIRLERAVKLPSRFEDRSLPAGHYAYAGNARGGGGIRARCRRHLRPTGVHYWHVDWLTNAANDVRAMAFPETTECMQIDKLSILPGVRFPIPGFGSTDCRQCPSHLIQINDQHASSIWQRLSATADNNELK